MRKLFMRRRAIIGMAFAILAAPASALNILLVNDDGLSGNIQAQYEALKTSGHDVLVSIPCQNQSGKGASIDFLVPLGPLTTSCRAGAADIGAPGVGPIAGKPDYHYVNGTPVMATAYGLDVLAPQRWGRAPDLVLSGPNEGQNAGPLVNSSGTVSNAQYAASLGISAIAVSADTGMKDDAALAVEVSRLTLKLIDLLAAKSSGGRLLPAGVALNVNYPKFSKGQGARLQWSFSRHGSYSKYGLKFVTDLSQAGVGDAALPGLAFRRHFAPPTKLQSADEAAVLASGRISVTAMQVGFDADARTRARLRRILGGLLDDGQ